MLYFFGQGVLNNMVVGDVVSRIRQADALVVARKDWKAIFGFNLYGDPSVSLFGKDPVYRSDVVFLLDGSGSMVVPETGKWQAAVDSAVLFYDLLRAFREPTFDDRYNSVVFRWLTLAGIDGTTTVPAGTGMKELAIPLTVDTFNPEFTPQGSYRTPIGLGLRLGADQFETGTEQSLYTDHMIILLSDGKHNEGPDPLDVIQAADWPGSIRAFTVGLGEDDIEPETIEQIANAAYGDYRISPLPREIEGFFCEIFCDISWKLQDVTVVISDADGDGVDDTASAAIDRNKAFFVVVWDDPAMPLSFDLHLPDGSIVSPTDLGPYCTYYAPGPDGTHAYYICDEVPTELLGDWQFVNINYAGTPVPLSDVLLKVIVDPQTIAQFSIADSNHYTGQPITLTAKVTEDGKPKTGLTDIHAELVRSPALAIGTLMSENSPARDPTSSRQADVTARQRYLRGVMERLNISTLTKPGGARISLRDDGIGPDLQAGDGIYNANFEDTTYEGSYTFRFRARGKNRQDVTFDRTKTLSEYVKFAAHPSESQAEVVAAIVEPSQDLAKATLRVTPRNASADFLGPFRGKRIEAWSSVGDFEPQIIDHEDGSYSLTLAYPKDAKPLVSLVVGDVLVVDQLSLPEHELSLLWVFVIVLLSLLLIVWLLFYLAGRRVAA